jgi:peptide-methionine (S)-S-oxide reductase
MMNTYGIKIESGPQRGRKGEEIYLSIAKIVAAISLILFLSAIVPGFAHAEVLQVEFDPSRISFDELLQLFWDGHDPTRGRHGSQYRSILICENQEQYAAVQKSAAIVEKRAGRPIQTEVVVDKPFYSAEDYHQKWKLRQRRELFAELGKNFSTEGELLGSFAATKLNAIVGGHMSKAEIDTIADQLQLSAHGLRLLESVPTRMRDASGTSALR